MKFSALILAGGRSSRMQDPNMVEFIEKGLVKLHDKPLVSWVISALPTNTEQIYISANTSHNIYSRYGRVVPDDVRYGEYSGPLAGIASALKVCDSDWLYVVPVDVPRPPSHILQGLQEYVNDSGSHLAYIDTTLGLQPLFMLIHKNMYKYIDESVIGGTKRVRKWLMRYGKPHSINVKEDDFFNINTPADLERAHSIISA